MSQCISTRNLSAGNTEAQTLIGLETRHQCCILSSSPMMIPCFLEMILSTTKCRRKRRNRKLLQNDVPESHAIQNSSPSCVVNLESDRVPVSLGVICRFFVIVSTTLGSSIASSILHLGNTTTPDLDAD